MSSAPLLIDNADAQSRSDALKDRILPSLLAERCWAWYFFMAQVSLKQLGCIMLRMMAAIPPVFRAIDMLNLSNLRMIVVSALWSGLWAGLLLTAVQSR
jgi:hypothetical protein